MMNFLSVVLQLLLVYFMKTNRVYGIDQKNKECKNFAFVHGVASRASWHKLNITLNYGKSEEYPLVKKLAQGWFGEAFLGIDNKTQQQVVVKVYRENHARSKTMLREILILQHLCNMPNIIKLKDIVRTVDRNEPALVFEYVNCPRVDDVYKSLNASEIPFYMKKLLIALKHIHDAEILHRDIKPHNVLIDREKRELKVIDFGFGKFFYPDRNNTRQIGTHEFVSPEVLLRQKQYSYGIDIWAAGVTFASMLTKQYPFFSGSSTIDLLRDIAKYLGTDDMKDLVKNHRLPFNLHELHGSPKEKTGFARLQTKENNATVTDAAIDLLDKLLVINPDVRWSAAQALTHPYFDQVPDV